ncbi:hypothetical protein BGX38DRAFT_1261757 [Terfezia claveryi]|nr:hypothetical protein BGX38DRAFT_1261757 [Terfezia claveryi]
MGNICGKASDPDTPSAGRRLGSGPTTTGASSTYGGALNQNPTAPIPTAHKKSSSKPKVTGPGRTVGESVSSGGEDSVRDAREAAARAAEAREQAAKAAGKGALSSKLDVQKRQTRNQQIQELSQQKKIDNNEAIAWN